MSEYKNRFDSAFPYSDWRPFPDEAIVQVKNAYGGTLIGPSKKFWWGYEDYIGKIAEGVITKARRLDKPKSAIHTLDGVITEKDIGTLKEFAERMMGTKYEKSD